MIDQLRRVRGVVLDVVVDRESVGAVDLASIKIGQRTKRRNGPVYGATALRAEIDLCRQIRERGVDEILAVVTGVSSREL